MDFSVGRLADRSGTISIRRTIEMSEHETVSFPLSDFPEPIGIDDELTASLSGDDFNVSEKEVSMAPADKLHSRRQDTTSLGSEMTQHDDDPDEWDAPASTYGSETEPSGSLTSFESDVEYYDQVYWSRFLSVENGLSWNALGDQSQVMTFFDHHFYLEQEDNYLFRAPVGFLHCVLDLGTGTGIWAHEIAATYPSAKVIGTDIVPIQPGPQPNCRFEIENMNHKWAKTPGSYDMVHGRGLMGNVNDFHSLCTKAIAVLKPAGYLEIADKPLRFTGKNGPLDPNNVWFRVSQEIQQLNRMLDRPYDNTGPRGIKASMARAGFQTVYETQKTIPVTRYLEAILDQIDRALSFKLCYENISDRQMTTYIRRLRRDLILEADGVCIEYVRIWGQKPCLQLVARDISEHGLRVAMLRAKSRFLRKAFAEISEDGSNCASHYRRVTSGDDELRIPIEWVILCTDIRNSPYRAKFLLCLEFLVLTYLGDYDSVEIDKLLDKDEEELLNQFRLALPMNVSSDVRIVTYHLIALFRGLFEAVGGNKDPLQHCFDPSVPPIVNYEMCCEVFGLKGSNPFENINEGSICQALSRSKLLRGHALGAEDISQFERLCRSVLGMDNNSDAEEDMDVDDVMNAWTFVERFA